MKARLKLSPRRHSEPGAMAKASRRLRPLGKSRPSFLAGAQPEGLAKSNIYPRRRVPPGNFGVHRTALVPCCGVEPVLGESADPALVAAVGTLIAWLLTLVATRVEGLGGAEGR